MKKSPAKPYYVPTSIQKLIVFSVLGITILQLVFTLASSIAQYRSNSNLGGLYSYLFLFTFMPILFFIAAYAMNPRHLERISRTFESLIVTLAALFGQALFSSLVPLLYRFSEGSINLYSAYQIGSGVVFYAVFVIVLIVIRKKGIWR